MSYNPKAKAATLPHMAEAAHAFTTCGRCDKDKPPEGGIHLNPRKWVCVTCWKAVDKRISSKINGGRWGAQ